MAGESEVSEFDRDVTIIVRIFFIHKEIIEFNVPVDNIILVAVRYTLSHFVEYLADFVFGEFWTIISLVQVLPEIHLHILLHNAYVVLILEEVEAWQDARVVHLLHEIVLIVSVQTLLKIHFPFSENFDGHILLFDMVTGSLDICLTPLSNLTYNFVPLLELFHVLVIGFQVSGFESVLIFLVIVLSL